MTDTGTVLKELERRYHAFARRHRRPMPWDSEEARRQAHTDLAATVTQGREHLARIAPRAQTEDQQALYRRLLVQTELADASLNEP